MLDSHILTNLLKDFANIFSAGVGNIMGDAKWLLGTLMVIDLVLAIIMNLDDGDHLKTLFKKILKYGLFIWIVFDYKHLVKVLLDSFTMIGLKAGGGGLSMALLTDPSSISEYGIYVSAPIFNYINSLGGLDTIMNLPKIMISGITGLLIIACFFIVGIQFFITYLEFYVIATVALILIPFGAFKHTAFLGEKAIGAVISFGIKLMVLSFIASAAIPLIKVWALPNPPLIEDCFHLLLGSFAIAMLAWHVPNLAAGLLSGTPSLHSSGAAGFALAGVAAAGAVADHGKAAGQQIANNPVAQSVGRGMSSMWSSLKRSGSSAASSGNGAPPATPSAPMNAAKAATRLSPSSNSIPP
jgi:type IV secretion system protein TrbL